MRQAAIERVLGAVGRWLKCLTFSFIFIKNSTNRKSNSHFSYTFRYVLDDHHLVIANLRSIVKLAVMNRENDP